MNNNVKTGLISMIAWILFVIILCGGYLLATHQTIEYFKDEDTGWVIPSIFFIVWALIWYGIGYHAHKKYIENKAVYMDMHKKDSREKAAVAFRSTYLGKQSKMLSRVFLCAVPFYVALNISEIGTAKNIIVVGILMIISVLLYSYHQTHK